MNRPNRAVRPSAILALLLASPLVLTGCDSAREMAGLNKKAPDEFSVVTKAPLVMPPEFGLRPPEPGAARPQEVSARERAQAVLGGGGRGEAAGQIGPLQRNAPQQQVQRSAGEQVLLQQARATNADPDIRRKVNEEFSQLAERDSGFVNRLVNWQNKDDPTANVVDPAKEQQRLRENTARGESPTKGDVPTIKRRERGMLEGLF